jgi:hypothetical protein
LCKLIRLHHSAETPQNQAVALRPHQVDAVDQLRDAVLAAWRAGR